MLHEMSLPKIGNWQSLRKFYANSLSWFNKKYNPYGG